VDRAVRTFLLLEHHRLHTLRRQTAPVPPFFVDFARSSAAIRLHSAAGIGSYEGLVGKDEESKYIHGTTLGWLKLKRPDARDVVAARSRLGLSGGR
jgi:ATP-dependent DNA ligase